MIGQRAPVCYQCGLPDPYHGRGDGIGSCDCPRCQGCDGAPDDCVCADDGRCPICGRSDCQDDCEEDDSWSPPDGDWVWDRQSETWRQLETVTTREGLL